MSLNEKEIKVLLEKAEKDIATDNLKDAGDKISQALEKARKMGNHSIITEIMEFIKSFSYSPESQAIELSRIKTEGFILDIEGGGEGIIGKLNNS